MVDDVSSTPDFISNLPNNMVETILNHLPLRDAVRTSILSKKWRHKWETLPKLVFDSTFEENLKAQPPTKNDILLTIYQVLLLHRGPVLKFTLEISGLGSCSEIDHMVQFVSRNGIRDLTLSIKSSEHYIIPSCLFSCLELRRLYLAYCLFEPSVTFNGFSRLLCADFRNVSFGTNVLQNLILKCPLLECLVLENCNGIGHLHIFAPKLKYFDISSLYESIYFRDTPLLSQVSIGGNGSWRPNIKKGSIIDMLEVFGCLPSVEYLDIDYYFLMILAAGVVPERLPTTFDRLRSLVIDRICLNVAAEVSVAFCLIKSSPNLQKLEIYQAYGELTGDVDDVIEYSELQNQSDVLLDQLQEVEIRSIKGRKSELELVKLLLAKSPSLKKMHISPPPDNIKINEEVTLLKQITRFPRASTAAEICYSGRNESR